MVDLMACFLLGVAVIACDERAGAYADAVSRLPSAHWRLVPAIGIREGDYGRHDHRTGVVLLPAEMKRGQLFHEVGHRVLDALRADDGRRLIDHYCARFWPDGERVGRAPSSYGRRSCREDAAVAMRRLYEGDRRMRATDRGRWLIERVSARGGR